MNSGKIRAIGYWATTGIVALDFFTGGIANLVAPPQVVETMAHFGYPAYFTPLLGVWKLLGAIAIVAPRFPRLKEWAYAGIIFDVTAATVSILATGGGGAAALPLFCAALTFASWQLRPASRRLPPAIAASANAESRSVGASPALLGVAAR